MTVRDILKSIARRWYVFLLTMAAVMAAAAAMYVDGGSFSTRTTVVFTSPDAQNVLGDTTSSDSGVIAFAGAVATELNNGIAVQTYSSADAPYYGAGVREGVMVSLRNTGNQWVTSYPSAMIDVQIVGRTREWVEARQQQILDDIFAVTTAQQSSIVTSAADRITAEVEPLSMQIVEVGSTRTTQLLAGGSMLLVVLLAGGSLCVLVDRWALRMRRTRAVHRGRPSVAVGEFSV